jgi:hypothetical protein
MKGGKVTDGDVPAMPVQNNPSSSLESYRSDKSKYIHSVSSRYRLVGIVVSMSVFLSRTIMF